jgi:hypothetical protein
MMYALFTNRSNGWDKGCLGFSMLADASDDSSVTIAMISLLLDHKNEVEVYGTMHPRTDITVYEGSEEVSAVLAQHEITAFVSDMPTILIMVGGNSRGATPLAIAALPIGVMHPAY